MSLKQETNIQRTFKKYKYKKKLNNLNIYLKQQIP